VGNAAAYLDVQAEAGSFASYLWGFVDGVPVRNAWRTPAELPTTSPLAETVSRDLRRRGFRFVGPTICYAYLEATGVVMDHLTICHRFPELSAA
jgi:DNA-3-methyladenine glycosylase I